MLSILANLRLPPAGPAVPHVRHEPSHSGNTCPLTHPSPTPCLQGTLFPMCGMNLAFDREAIGPAMYFGLMGEGQPWGRYDGERWGPVLLLGIGVERHEQLATCTVASWARVSPGAATTVSATERQCVTLPAFCGSSNPFQACRNHTQVCRRHSLCCRYVGGLVREEGELGPGSWRACVILCLPRSTWHTLPAMRAPAPCPLPPGCFTRVYLGPIRTTTLIRRTHIPQISFCSTWA